LGVQTHSLCGSPDITGEAEATAGTQMAANASRVQVITRRFMG